MDDLNLDEILQMYQSNPTKGKMGSMSDKDRDLQQFVTLRVVKQIYKKVRVQQRWNRLQDFKDSYLRLLDKGEDYNAGIRFPTAFGISQRFYSELLDNIAKVKIKAIGKSGDDKSQMCAQALEYTVDYLKREGNYYTEHARMLTDCIDFGNGIKYVGYESDDADVYLRDDEGNFKPKASLKEQIYTRRVDPRRFFIDETALTLHDEASYIRARDCTEDRIIPISYFKKYYGNNPKYRNTDLVSGVSRDVSFYNAVITPFWEENSQNTTLTAGEYVHLYTYYNQEVDLMVMCANGIPIYDSRLEFNHKKLPYVHYKFYPRNDSVWANGVLEIVYNLIINNDVLNQLAMENMKFLLQRPLFISGDVDFNPGKQKLQPGAMLRVNGLKGGKLSDSIMPLEVGSLDQNYLNFRNILGDEMTVAIGDDARGLYSNPNQLATQTAYKERILTKRLKAMVKMQEYEAVRYETEMILELLKQFLLKDRKNKKPIMVDVEGFKVAQGSRGTRIPKFDKTPNYNDSFELVKDIFSVDYKIIIKDNITEGDENEDTIKNTMTFLNTLMQTLQIMPDLNTKIDLFAMIKSMAEKLNLDTRNIFPTLNKNTMDNIDKAIEAISLSIEPIPLETPTIDDIQIIIDEKDKQTYKNFNVQQKMMFENFLNNSLMNLKSSYAQNDNKAVPMQTPIQQGQVPQNLQGIPSPTMTEPNQPGQLANSQTANNIGK